MVHDEMCVLSFFSASSFSNLSLVILDTGSYVWIYVPSSSSYGILIPERIVDTGSVSIALTFKPLFPP